MHTREEVTNLFNDAMDVLHVTPDELFIAISRITNVRESEAKRIALVDSEHEKFAEDNRHEPDPGCGEDE